MDDKSLQGKPPYVLVKQWCNLLVNDDKRIDPAVKARALEMLNKCFEDDQAIIRFLQTNETKQE
jgi:hypothetical protein